MHGSCIDDDIIAAGLDHVGKLVEVLLEPEVAAANDLPGLMREHCKPKQKYHPSDMHLCSDIRGQSLLKKASSCIAGPAFAPGQLLLSWLVRAVVAHGNPLIVVRPGQLQKLAIHRVQMLDLILQEEACFHRDWPRMDSVMDLRNQSVLLIKSDSHRAAFAQAAR